MRSRVLLPEPFSPISPLGRPVVTVKVMSVRTRWVPNEAETPSTFRWVPAGPDVLDAAVPCADAEEGMRDEFTRVLGWSRSPPGSGLGRGDSETTHRDMAPTVGHGTGEDKG